MANEINSQLRLQYTNGVVKFDFNPGTVQLDFTALKMYRARLLITTSEVTVTHGVASPRFCILYNHDSTNYVEAGTTTTDYPIYLRPTSAPTQFEIGPSKSSLFLKANVASCYVEVIVF